MERTRVQQVLDGLADANDWGKLLGELELSAVEAMGLVRSSEGRREMRARLALARLHGNLVATRFSAYAVRRLCELLQEEKAEVRLKGALAVLELAGLADKRGRPRAVRKRGEGEEAPTGEMGELLAAVAAVLDQREEVALEGEARRGLPAAAASA